MIDEYYIVEWDLPVIAGTCTIGGQPGFGTPVTCTDQQDGTVTTKTYKFTDTSNIIDDGVFKCMASITETPVELKGGTGLASRATVSITFTDFVGVDPNPESPALTTTPNIKNKGTFFTKLDQRNYLTNKPLRVTRIGVDENGTEVYSETNAYLSQNFRKNKNGTWTLDAKDAMYRADASKSQYPSPVTGRLTADITAGQTSVIIEGDIAQWDASKHVAVIGDDILIITNVASSGSNVELTCTRASTITLGATNQRVITNTPAAHETGDEVFRGVKFIDKQIADILEDIFTEMGLDSSLWDYTEINNELTTWVSSPAINTIYYESEDTTDVLERLCSTYLIDVWFDTKTTVSYPEGRIKVKSTSPWVTTVKTLTEGEDFDYGTLSINRPEKKQFSRCFMQYNKKKLTANDDDVNFLTSSLAIDSEVEQGRFSGEVTVKRLVKSKILGNTNSDIQVADLTTRRFVARFSQKPAVYEFIGTSETIDGLGLGDVIHILSEDIIQFNGDPVQENRAQVISIKPIRDNIAGIKYMVKALTYDPFTGAVEGDPIPVISETNVNLHTEANAPIDTGGEYTFVFDGNEMYQSGGQTVTTGVWPDNSTVNIVCLNGADFRAKGGDGGDGADVATGGNGEDGQNGGNVLLCESSNTNFTLNIYLSGSRTVDGDLYTCDGKLIAPGAGGGGSGSFDEEFGSTGGDGGGGGAGRPFGLGGIGGEPFGDGGFGSDGNNGALDTGGIGGGSSNGGDGGDNGQAGDAGQNNDSTGGAGGLAGKGVIFGAGTTVTVYGDSTGGVPNNTRFINGNGDTPSFVD